jgi:aspartate/methionine/tyrosine aminotransferase
MVETKKTDKSKLKIKSFPIAVKESATLAINQKALLLRSKGKKLSHFGFGESPFPVHPKIQNALAENTDRKSYLPGLGLPELRERLAKFHNKYFHYDFSAENIAIGPGSKQMIFESLHLLEGVLLIPSPSWVSYQPQANILNKQSFYVPTYFKNNYQIMAEDLQQAAAQVSSEQKILILNSPNNPTGQSHNKENLARIAAVCKEQNIVVICDEIYALVSFDSLAEVLLQHCPERVIITSGMSKAFSAGGYRFGFLATHNEDFLKQLAVVVSETYSCVSAPIQYAALTAYSDDPEIMQYLSDCNKIHKTIISYVHRRLQAMGLNCLMAQGGFYLFPNFLKYQSALHKRGVDNSAQLCNLLMEEAALVSLPAKDFCCDESVLSVRLAVVDYDGQEAYQRYLSDKQFAQNISSIAPNIATGMDRLEQWLSNIK